MVWAENIEKDKQNPNLMKGNHLILITEDSDGTELVKSIHEVHHLDGNTFNNYPSNLQYVDNHTHSIITKHQRSVGKNAKYLKAFKSDFCSSDVLVWNRKDNLVLRKAFLDY